MWGMEALRSALASSLWCRQAKSVACQARMPTPPSEDANAHLQNFLELCDTIVIKDVAQNSIRLSLFPFSLARKAKQWFYQNKEAIDTWKKRSAAFLAKFFPMSRTSALRGKISTFQ